MGQFRVFSIAVYLVIAIICYCDGFKKGKYVLNYSSDVTICDDDDSLNFMEVKDLKTTRINETVASLDGPFKILRGIEKNTKLSIILSKVTQAGLEVLTTHDINDFCKRVQEKDSNNLYSPYMSKVDIPDCPIPAGNYTITNMVIDTTNIKLGGYMEGTYRAHFNYYHTEVEQGLFGIRTDTFLGCLHFDVSLEPLE